MRFLLHVAQEAATVLVSWHTGLHPALSNVENGLLLLPRYLKGIQRLLTREREWPESDAPLPRTALNLWQNLSSLCSQAADLLSSQLV